jgi:hypothetical protein
LELLQAGRVAEISLCMYLLQDCFSEDTSTEQWGPKVSDQVKGSWEARTEISEWSTAQVNSNN